MDPIAEHVKKTKAKEFAVANGGSEIEITHGSVYDLNLAQLAIHKRQLQNVESRIEKAKLKATLLPEYDAYIEGILEADKGGQDNVLINMMIWRLDAGQFEKALELATYAIKHKLVMPEGFKRSISGFFVEESYKLLKKEAEEVIEHKGFISEFFDQFVDADMFDEIKAKLYVLYGSTLESDEPSTALSLFKKAVSLDEAVGVKGRINRLKKQLVATELVK